MWCVFIFLVLAVAREIASILVAFYLRSRGGLYSYVVYDPDWFSVVSVVALAGTTGYLFF